MTLIILNVSTDANWKFHINESYGIPEEFWNYSVEFKNIVYGFIDSAILRSMNEAWWNGGVVNTTLVRNSSSVQYNGVSVLMYISFTVVSFYRYSIYDKRAPLCLWSFELHPYVSYPICSFFSFSYLASLL